MSWAKEVADLILAESQSGSGAWDELNGPESQLKKTGPDQFTITIPVIDWESETGESDEVCIITIEVRQRAE
jgi:hypothetical protein